MEMKIKINIILLTLFGSMVGIAQTPQEEQAQKMMDSIMQNMPESQRAMMKQMMQKGKEADAKRKVQREQMQKAQATKSEANHEKSIHEFYWRNRIASNKAGKFENWAHGQAEIRTTYWGRDRTKNEIIIGSISASGQVTIALPDIDKSTIKTMSTSQHESERVVGNTYLELNYSNKNAGYLSTRHNANVYAQGQRIGFIDIGNDIKPVVNLNAPCCFDKAGDGYTAYWIYTSPANRIKGTKNIDGAEGRIVCDLNFQSGWNLVMERVEGAREKPSSGMSGPGFWKNQYYTAAASMPIDAKFYFTLNK